MKPTVHYIKRFNDLLYKEELLEQRVSIDYYEDGSWLMVGDFKSLNDFINIITSEEWRWKFQEILGKKIRFWFGNGEVYIIDK